MPDGSLQNAVLRACLYLTYLRTAFSPGTFVKNNQKQLFNITSSWGCENNGDKQEADQKT